MYREKREDEKAVFLFAIHLVNKTTPREGSNICSIPAKDGDQ